MKEIDFEMPQKMFHYEIANLKKKKKLKKESEKKIWLPELAQPSE